MVNQEFQELIKTLQNNPSGNANVIDQMRANLLSRNSGDPSYTLRNFEYPLTWDINACNAEQLIAIDKDMNTQNNQTN